MIDEMNLKCIIVFGKEKSLKPSNTIIFDLVQQFNTISYYIMLYFISIIGRNKNPFNNKYFVKIIINKAPNHTPQINKQSHTYESQVK